MPPDYARLGLILMSVRAPHQVRLSAALLPITFTPQSIVKSPTKRRMLKKAWMKAFGTRCLFCECDMTTTDPSQPTYATLDHIDARCLGGKNELRNFQVICRSCNQSKAREEHLAYTWLRKRGETK